MIKICVICVLFCAQSERIRVLSINQPERFFRPQSRYRHRFEWPILAENHETAKLTPAAWRLRNSKLPLVRRSRVWPPIA